MNLLDFDAFSFDCYGTLIDWEEGIGRVLQAWADDQHLGLNREDLLTAYARHEAETAAATPAALYPEILEASFRAMGGEFGVSVSRQWARRLATSVPDWPAFPDSHQALVTLGEGHQLIILSNVDRENFEASRRRLGINFDHVLTAQDLGSYKPSPRNFAALQRLREQQGIPPGRLLHVAQSLFHDHVPAQAVGLPTVWINRRHAQPGWGATPPPGCQVKPNWTFPDMAAFAAAYAQARSTASHGPLPGSRLRSRGAGEEDDGMLSPVED
jgi:2-haloacid dehalogenase